MIIIRELRKQDYKKARQFAIQGMHLYWYVSGKISLDLYARYFLSLELSRATRTYGAYVDDQFVGILLADMKDEPKKYRSIWRTAYIRFFDRLQHLAAGDGVEAYDKANQEMLHAFCEKSTPDGEIIFLAADPNSKIKGIGTALLSALERDEHGKLVYLYTDNACTYQFYEHRGFVRAGEQNVVLNLEKSRFRWPVSFTKRNWEVKKMRHKVKVTVLDKKLYPELQQQYCADPASGVCPCYNVGDEFMFYRDDERNDFWHMGLNTLVRTTGDADAVAGGPKTPFCSEAWDAISRYIYTGLQGGSIMKGWMRSENEMITCCSDGTRPVIFKIERIDYE